MKSCLRRAASLTSLGLVAAAFAAAPAHAGTQVVTGDDEHCSGSSDAPDICDATRKYLEYARGGAPDPRRPILAIDCDDADYITDAYDEDPGIVVLCPEDPAYAETEFTTAQFSAIAVGEGEADDGALNPREADFRRFFDQGGGIATFNSTDGEDANAEFLPLDVTVLGNAPSNPYATTDAGREVLGITDEEINSNCCQHESFADPADGSPLQVGVRGGSDEASRGDSSSVPQDAALVLFGRVQAEQEDDDDESDDDDDDVAPAPPVVEQQPVQQLPDPLSFTALFGTQRSATVSTTGLFVVPGMTENCAVGPCQVYERGFTAKPGAQASSHANDKRHGLLARDRDVLASGQSNAVRMRLGKAANRKLRRTGRLRMEAMVTVTDARGRSQLVRKTITLRTR